MSDLDFDALELVRHQRRLQRLAFAILGEASLAEDAVQETWLAALRSDGPRGDAGSWLAGILRNRARKLRRGEARRAEREARAAELAARCDDEVDAALSSGRALVEAVDRLAEPYRSAVVLRFLREESPPAIAERLGVPLETVRTRLRRGLAELRARLDREHSGWVLALLPSASAPATASAGLLPLLLTLGGTMSFKLVLAGVAIAIAGALFWSTRGELAPDSGPALAAPAPQPELPATSAPSGAPSPALDPPLRAARERTPATTAPEEEALAAPILCVELRGWVRADAGDVLLRLWAADGDLRLVPSTAVRPMLASAARHPERSEPDERSVIRLSLPALLGPPETWPSTVELASEHPDFLPARAWVELGRAAEGIDVVLRLERAALIVRGVAKGPDGSALPHGKAALFATGAAAHPLDEPEELVELAQDGAFRLRSRSAGPHVLLVHDAKHLAMLLPGTEHVPQLAPLTLRLPATGERERDLGALELGLGLSIRGVVRDFAGAGGSLTALASDAWSTRPSLGYLSWVDGAFVLVMLHARAGGDGRFQLSGLAPIEYELQPGARERSGDDLVVVSLRSTTSSTIRVRPPVDDVVIESTGLRCVLVVLSGGGPLTGASVSLHGALQSTSSSLPRRHRAALEFPADETVRLLVQHPEHEPLELELARDSIPADGELTVELEPAAPRAALLVRALGPHAGELAAFSLAVRVRASGASDSAALPAFSPSLLQSQPADYLAWDPPPKPPSLRLSRAEDGFRLDGVPPGRYELSASPLSDPDRAHAPLARSFELELEPGEQRSLDWPVELGVMPRVSITGEPADPITHVRLVGPDGPVEGLWWHSASSTARGLSASRFPFQSGRSVAQSALPLGSYRLELLRGLLVVHTHPFTLALGGSAEISVDVTDR